MIIINVKETAYESSEGQTAEDVEVIKKIFEEDEINRNGIMGFRLGQFKLDNKHPLKWF